jgi:hypothetical protein
MKISLSQFILFFVPCLEEKKEGRKIKITYMALTRLLMEVEKNVFSYQ